MGDVHEVRPLRLQPFRTEAGWFFRLLGANGEIIAGSEGYESAEARNDTMRLIECTPIVVVEGPSDG